MNDLAITRLRCQHCGATLALPGHPPEKLAQAADLLRAKRATRALATLFATTVMRIRTFWKFTSFKLRQDRPNMDEMRAVLTHITKTHDTCHVCRAPLTARGQSECPNCLALNLDW